MDTVTIARRCAAAGIEAGRTIRETIHAMDLSERARPCTSLLKPRGNVYADAAAEAIGLQCLERLSRELGIAIHIVPDAGQRPHRIGQATGDRIIWASLDAIDGTVKVAGLGNDLAHAKIRAANDGAWSATLAFTAPTATPLTRLRLGDFVAASVVDGNPTRYTTYPQEVIAVPDANGCVHTYEVRGASEQPLFTTSNDDLSQSMVLLDSFQAHDLETRGDGDAAVAVELYRLLTNRHAGGAYDVLRQFGSLSALQRTMLGWHDSVRWYEAQGAAFIVVNENLPNLIPAIPIVEGAGGICVDFDDHLLRERPLSAGRTSAVYAANPAVRRQVLEIVGRSRAGTS